MSAVPFICERCGQRGDQPPGFRREPIPEAVGFAEGGMIPIDYFTCQSCGKGYVFPAGRIEVRKP